jgi:hypothetical protein
MKATPDEASCFHGTVLPPAGNGIVAIPLQND